VVDEADRPDGQGMTSEWRYLAAGATAEPFACRACELLFMLIKRAWSALPTAACCCMMGALLLSPSPLSSDASDAVARG
jgi:hypothetical protein